MTAALLFVGPRFVTSQDNKQPQIHVEDFHSSQIIGRLGVPLGQVVIVEGTMIEENSRQKGRDGAKSFRISTVDDRPLDEAVAFWEEDVVRGGKRRTVWADGRYRLAVYETGQFDGWPNGDTYRPVPQTRGFHFRSELVIVHNFADGTAERQQSR